MININWNPGPKDLRQFGIAMIVGFAIIGLLFLFVLDRPGVAPYCFGFGAIAGLLGLTGTRAALIVYIPWMAIAFVMGNIVSRVLLALFYFLVMTPIGLIRRVFQDPLQLRKPVGPSYWHPLPPPKEPENYERQF
jgi:hypothetical protein